nr:response regulator [Nocardioides panaciterrulae]
MEANGSGVTWCRDGRAALSAVNARAFDLALLDLGLPDVDGIEVCRLLKRRQPQCVVVVLTARRDEMDVIEGLSRGRTTT